MKKPILAILIAILLAAGAITGAIIHQTRAANAREDARLAREAERTEALRREALEIERRRVALAEAAEDEKRRKWEAFKQTDDYRKAREHLREAGYKVD